VEKEQRGTAAPARGGKDMIIELLRWLAMIGVLIQHSNFVGRYSDRTVAAITMAQQLTAWCVLLFFSVSGYLTSDRGAPFVEVVRRRARRLLVPFVLCSTVSFLGMLLIRRLGIYQSADAAADLTWRALGERLVLLQGFGPQYYFLPYLFLAAVGAAALGRFISGAQTFVLCAVVLALQCALAAPPPFTTGYGLDRIPLYALAFALGRVLRPENARFHRPVLLALAATTVVALGLVAAGIHALWLVHLGVPVWMYLVLRRLGAGPHIPARLVSQSTGAVYLWHAPIILPACTVMLARAHITEGLNLVTAWAVTIAICLALHAALGKLRLQSYLSL
jgi:hypothetical protein